MKLMLQKLQKANNKGQRRRQEKPNGKKKIDKIFHHQNLRFVSKAI